MKKKPKTPYQRLMEDIQAFCRKIILRKRTNMFYFSRASLNKGKSYHLNDVYERCMAAQQLGHEIHLVADDQGLMIQYTEKSPDVPYKWK